MRKNELKNLILSAMFLALGVVLPLFTTQIKEIGDSLLPMHIPVLLCGALCGWKYGAVIGFILPFFRSIIFSMPPIYPNAVWMAFELLAYGAVFGFLYNNAKRKNVLTLYLSLISALLAGRIVWAIVKTLLLSFAGKTFTFSAFLMGGFVDAIPGLALQLVLVPLVVMIAEGYKK